MQGLKNRHHSGAGPRALLFALAAVVFLVLAACGEDEPAADDDDEAAAEPEAPAEDDEGADEDGEAAASDEEQVVWRWEHALPLPDSSFDQVMTEDLPQMLEEATDGRLTLDVVYGETNPVESLDAISQGRADGGVFVTTFYGGDFPAWNVGEVAFLFDDFQDFREGMEQVGPLISEDVREETGLRSPAGPLPWTSTYVWTKDIALETREDWEGARIRAAGVESAKTIEALGGAAVQMQFGEVYPSLERGVIDGFMSSMGATVAINPWEVTDFLNLWPMGFSTFHAVINPEAFEALDDDLQETVLDTFERFREHTWDVVEEDDAQQLNLQEENGMEIVEPSEEAIESLRAQRDELLRDWLDRSGESGREIIDELGVEVPE